MCITAFAIVELLDIFGWHRSQEDTIGYPNTVLALMIWSQDPTHTLLYVCCSDFRRDTCLSVQSHWELDLRSSHSMPNQQRSSATISLAGRLPHLLCHHQTQSIGCGVIKACSLASTSSRRCMAPAYCDVYSIALVD
jgi:hypothetical protein